MGYSSASRGDHISQNSMLNDPATSRFSMLSHGRAARSSLQPISDPLTLLLMYKRKLLQETNNGLMGGATFYSQVTPAATIEDCSMLFPVMKRGLGKVCREACWGLCY